MSIARRQLNATLLPDGTVLVTGGTFGPGFNNTSTPVYPAELWNPATETWTTLASATVPRLYHSAALLLPDGRVLSTGGNDYRRPRPFRRRISSRAHGRRCPACRPPSATASASRSRRRTRRASRKVTLIRITSVTHAFNPNQRLNVLSFTPTSGGLDIVAPANGNVAPPGHYLLFLVNGTASLPSEVSCASRTARSPASASAAIDLHAHRDENRERQRERHGDEQPGRHQLRHRLQRRVHTRRGGDAHRAGPRQPGLRGLGAPAAAPRRPAR